MKNFLRSCLLLTFLSFGIAANSQTIVFHEAVPTFTTLPTDWTSNNGGGQAIMQTATSGYLLVDHIDDWVITKAYDLSSFVSAKIYVDVATYGSGDNNPLTIQVSNDGGTTWTHQTFITETPTSTTYILGGEFNVTATSNQVKFKFIRNASTGKGVRFRNIKLEGYQVAGTLSNFAVTPTAANTGQQVTFTWDAVDVTAIKFQAFDGEEWFDLEELTNVDASLGTINFVIPADAEEGTYLLRIVDRNNSAVVSNTASIVVSDVTFAGLRGVEGLFPATDAIDVPIDLFKVWEYDGGGFAEFRKLVMQFNEEVKAGTGSVKLYKASGDELVYSFDVSSISVSFDRRTVIVALPANLAPNTDYYVTIDNGAITDNASTPNLFDGNVVWEFRTGAKDSYRTIAEIREPIDLNVSDASPYLGQNLVTAGLVIHKRSNGVYIQDDTQPWSGLFVFDSNFAPGVQVGDWVALIGKVSAFNNMTQLQNILSLNVTGQFPLPEPVVITMPFDKTNSEKWESMLVKVENVVHTTEGPAVTGVEFKVSDGTNIGIIDDYQYNGFTPTEGQEFSYIAGIMNNYQASYKLAPRNADDIVTKPTNVKNTESVDLIIYPNPVINEIRVLSSESIAKVEVTNMAGQVVANSFKVVGQEVVVPVNSKVNGVVVVKITTEGGKVVVKKVLKQ